MVITARKALRVFVIPFLMINVLLSFVFVRYFDISGGYGNRVLKYSPGQNLVEETRVIRESKWLAHLCPKYRINTNASLDIVTWTPLQEDVIFFVKTTCQTKLSAREACAVESAIHHHPQHLVVLFTASPTITRTHPVMKILLKMDNFRVSWLDLDEVFSEDPLLSWHRDRLWMLSGDRTPAVLNDAVRTELLHRYGGTYVDLDAIILKSLPNITNWMARVDDRLITSAVSRFRPGHPMLKEITQSIPRVYAPSSCCSIGPELFTQRLIERCPENITQPTSTQPEYFEFCQDMTIFPRKLFYPIHYGYKSTELESIFTEGLGLGPAFFKQQEAYSLHLYHSLSNKRDIDLKSDSIVAEAAKRNCPMIYKALKAQNRRSQ
ncbi:hypothetical protein SK128_018525 [Halocaridina rubra]|uniref:Alpha 1,4-glycosyltransferase domain-containing protein n=1 Tax=Halocaridina rubra TaxID=373956 RepID=A0AAN8ZWR1_HALRR